MRLNPRSKNQGFTVVEIMVALTMMAITAVAMTQSMLVLNRNSAQARVRNLAKATVLSRTQEVAAVEYSPTATPPVVPALLSIQAINENIDLGDSSTGLGTVSGKLFWTVTDAGSNVRSVRCRVVYTYLGRSQNYEVLTFRSPD